MFSDDDVEGAANHPNDQVVDEEQSTTVLERCRGGEHGERVVA